MIAHLPPVITNTSNLSLSSKPKPNEYPPGYSRNETDKFTVSHSGILIDLVDEEDDEITEDDVTEQEEETFDEELVRAEKVGDPKTQSPMGNMYRYRYAGTSIDEADLKKGHKRTVAPTHNEVQHQPRLLERAQGTEQNERVEPVRSHARYSARADSNLNTASRQANITPKARKRLQLQGRGNSKEG
jgi:hypothetical protein